MLFIECDMYCAKCKRVNVLVHWTFEWLQVKVTMGSVKAKLVVVVGVIRGCSEPHVSRVSLSLLLCFFRILKADHNPLAVSWHHLSFFPSLPPSHMW